MGYIVLRKNPVMKIALAGEKEQPLLRVANQAVFLKKESADFWAKEYPGAFVVELNMV